MYVLYDWYVWDHLECNHFKLQPSRILLTQIKINGVPINGTGDPQHGTLFSNYRYNWNWVFLIIKVFLLKATKKKLHRRHPSDRKKTETVFFDPMDPFLYLKHSRSRFPPLPKTKPNGPRSFVRKGFSLLGIKVAQN